jgi:hypothetical protein
MPVFGRAKKLLGISIGERACLIAEVSAPADSAPVARIVEFAYPPGVTLEHSDALGEALAHFLQRQGFSEKHVVFGVPAKWLVLKPHLMPPTDESTAASILWLQATTHTSPELGAMVFDYLGHSDEREASNVLLVGLQQRWIDRLLAIARGAGLKPSAITPAAVELGSATSLHVSHSLVLSLGIEGAELVAQDGKQTTFVRYIGAGNAVQPLLAELRRVAATNPVEFDLASADVKLPAEAKSPPDAKSSPEAKPPYELASHGRAARSLVLWDDAGTDAGFVEALRAGAGMPLIEANPSWVDIAASDQPEKRKGLTAVALTLAARTGEKPVIDFLHSRLHAPREQRFSRRTQYIAIVAAVVLLLGLAGLLNILNIERQISATDSELATLQPALSTAKPFVANMQFMESYEQVKPKYLACLVDLTNAVAPDAQTTFTGFNLQSTMRGEVVGKSDSEQTVLNFRDKLSAGGRFTEINCKWNSSTGRGAAGGRGGRGGAPQGGAPQGGMPGGAGMPQGAGGASGPSGASGPGGAAGPGGAPGRGGAEGQSGGPGSGAPQGPPDETSGPPPGAGAADNADASPADSGPPAGMTMTSAAPGGGKTIIASGPNGMPMVINPGSLPPGVVLPGGGQPTGGPAAMASPGPQLGGGAGAASPGVTFTMTFTYNPKK